MRVAVQLSSTNGRNSGALVLQRSGVEIDTYISRTNQTIYVDWLIFARRASSMVALLGVIMKSTKSWYAVSTGRYIIHSHFVDRKLTVQYFMRQPIAA